MPNNYILTSSGSFISTDELYHHGIKGMKWGVRKKQTAVGLARTARRSSSSTASMNSANAAYKQARAAYKQAKKQERNSPEAKAHRAAKAKRAAKVGAAVAATALAAYGAYKLNKYVKTKNGEIAAKRGFEAAQKEFHSLSKSMFNEVNSGRATGAKLTVNAGARAISDARAASKDNFRTAAKNVINYKRSGGSLGGLTSVGMYDGLGIHEMDLRRKR